MSNHFTLTLSLEDRYGTTKHCVSVRVPEDIAREISRIRPPSDYPEFSMDFDAAVTIMKRREFRKSLFIEEARRMGDRLATYMEDKEGWHGIERKERIEAALKEG